VNPPAGRRGLANFLGWFFHHLYTTLASAYDAVAWLSSLGQWASWRRTALGRLPSRRPVLEVGFGTGHLQIEGWQRGLPVFGVDASAQMARLTRRRLKHAVAPMRIVRARAQALPFVSRSFAAAFSTFPSEYIFEVASLTEIHRVLASPGSLVVVPSARIRPRFLWEHLTRWLYNWSGQAPGPDPKWLAPFRQAGFDARFETVDVPGASVLHIVASR
jgi:ubiquinone/menaquinone biosynthesis C-methylase UbiE